VDKRIGYVLVGVALIAAGVAAYFIFGHSSVSLGGSDIAVAVDILPTDRIRGAANAPVTIVEYASMTCPHCARFEKEVMPKLIHDYIDPGKVKVIFRDFPLDGAARLASALARCVPEDKYYPFVDLLFANQAKWLADLNGDGRVTADEVVEGLAQMGRFVGFSREKVESCISDQSTLAYIDQTQANAQAKYGINSTPTFIINGEINREGEVHYEDLRKIIATKLANK
jgi:protein-disulfide isomerase